MLLNNMQGGSPGNMHYVADNFLLWYIGLLNFVLPSLYMYAHSRFHKTRNTGVTLKVIMSILYSKNMCTHAKFQY
jgi:hypothetical protein